MSADRLQTRGPPQQAADHALPVRLPPIRTDMGLARPDGHGPGTGVHVDRLRVPSHPADDAVRRNANGSQVHQIHEQCLLLTHMPHAQLSLVRMQHVSMLTTITP